MGRRRDSNAYVSDEDDRRSKRGDDFKPFKQWFPWLIPSFVAANCVMFVVSMFVNDCPAKSRNCIGAEFLGRFAFQPLKENPLLGPSSDALHNDQGRNQGELLPDCSQVFFRILIFNYM
ncbi:RHOMBOID-like protein 1 [Linum grandiflorum]